jgi:hypothetical protein
VQGVHPLRTLKVADIPGMVEYAIHAMRREGFGRQICCALRSGDFASMCHLRTSLVCGCRRRSGILGRLMQRILLTWPRGELIAVLEDTPTARKLIAALPCRSSANTWGEEVYFSVPVRTTLEPDARQVVEPGTVCFWVEGSSLALPYGPTPVSEGDECRLVSRVNVLGKLEGDPRRLADIHDGDSISVALA